MYIHETKIRIRYGETDQMGYVYYGNYAQFFEIGRVEMLRSIDFNYKKLEEEGIMLPVSNFSVRYLKPAFYDDLITVRTIIKKIPTVKILFNYEILNEEGVLLTTAETTLVFVNKLDMKPTYPPLAIIEKFKQKFDSE